MASDALITLTDANFDEQVASGVTLVDFWAPWCGPCLMQTPILESVGQQLGDRVKIGKVNVDENMQVAVRFGIRSIPTLILFKDGRVVQQFVGVQPEHVLISAIESA